MKSPFYILGLLIRFGPQHGYSLQQYISQEIEDFAKIKMPTIYYNLEKLKDRGYVTATSEKEGNRPEKTVYEATNEGRKYFEILIKEVLNEEFLTEFKLDGILYFIDLVDSQLLMASLINRRKILLDKIQYIKEHQENIKEHIPPNAVFLAKMIFDHHLIHMEAEYKWLEQLIKGLS